MPERGSSPRVCEFLVRIRSGTRSPGRNHWGSSDSRSGTTDYRLTKLRRVDPPQDLFVIPLDYKLLDPKSAGSNEDPWLTDSALERYIADLAAGG